MAAIVHEEEGRHPDPERLDGFPSLSHFISLDNDAAIFRRFDRLGARNLLSLQSIVISLEKKLDDHDRNDAKQPSGNPATRSAARRVPRTEDGDDIERVELMEQIAVAMRNYREALLQEQQVLALKNPSQRPLATLRRYFFGGKRDGAILSDRDAHMLDDERDLVALAPVDDDRLGSFLRDHFGCCCRDRKRTSQPGLKIFYFSERRIHFAGNVISTVFCAILLLGAMAVLSVLDSQSWKVRLGLVALFTSLFAFTVGLLTSARRAEMFGSTAAYAAVLVVYVSQGLGPATH
ncbi:hypothetical protein VTL71DRAFT_9632 [Oculimacula yallundae]|uniref:DUF6594 domain-containing protein n=1 Tax=Oculimacula yallundae TaxID=86028 RepID=A0ABR4BRD1_9HELO